MRALWCRYAVLPGSRGLEVAEGVVLHVDGDRLAGVGGPGVAGPHAGTQPIDDGVVVPGLVDAHLDLGLDAGAAPTQVHDAARAAFERARTAGVTTVGMWLPTGPPDQDDSVPAAVRAARGLVRLTVVAVCTGDPTPWQAGMAARRGRTEIRLAAGVDLRSAAEGAAATVAAFGSDYGMPVHTRLAGDRQVGTDLADACALGPHDTVLAPAGPPPPEGPGGTFAVWMPGAGEPHDGWRWCLATGSSGRPLLDALGSVPAAGSLAAPAQRLEAATAVGAQALQWNAGAFQPGALLDATVLRIEPTLEAVAAARPADVVRTLLGADG